ncbi:MAG: hypothetical protein WCR48_02390 [Bacteroidales bacterium]
MKNIAKLLFVAVLAISCDRDLEFDTISVTAPALEVIVEGTSNAANVYPKISGATVELYSSEGTLLKTATSDQEGKVEFSKADLKEKGIFSVKAAKGSLSGEGKTAYMLLNDGVTLLIVTIQ